MSGFQPRLLEVVRECRGLARRVEQQEVSPQLLERWIDILDRQERYTVEAGQEGREDGIFFHSRELGDPVSDLLSKVKIATLHTNRGVGTLYEQHYTQLPHNPSTKHSEKTLDISHSKTLKQQY